MFKNLIKTCTKNIIGNENNIKLSLACIICEGSILIEDYPGTGKTTFAKTITYNLGLDFKRIQFTSDLLPADILGYNFFKGEHSLFQKGPIFTNVILADELNRGSAKSQSAFLEAMEEKNVTIDGETYKLPRPFFVIATQNPMDSSGTSLLLDSQLDRFMISFSLAELNSDQKKQVLKNDVSFNQIIKSNMDWNKIKKQKNLIKVNETVFEYILNIENLINQLKKDFFISTRCLKQISELAKGWALIDEREYVTHQDIKEILPSILRHRIRFLNNEKEKINFINKEILDKIEIPK